MVKIVNTAGDIKTGVQGRVVYQRKYGQQIRRMREPKRAMASEAQIRHRQLYRAALDWRKTLSLANRRSLDGYAIANWIVDDHKIPLPWHRLALKLYLKHVKFSLSDIVTGGTEGFEGTFESQELYNYTLAVYGIKLAAQTITPLQGHLMTSAEFMLFRDGFPGLLELDIFVADAEHKPTGGPLCSGSINGNLLHYGTPAEWEEITLGAGALLSTGREYVLQLKVASGDSSNHVRYYAERDTNPYSRGMRIYSNDDGATWITAPTDDFTFRDKGSVPPSYYTTATVHINHPALKTITRKHEGIIAQKWENMSSIDEDRLTNHLTLSADTGDLIEVTTIADLTTKFQL